MRSAMDQRTIVVTKRKMKTERGVTVFGSACSSVAGMHSHHLDGQELCPQITYANADEFAAERRCHRVPYGRPGRRGSNQAFSFFPARHGTSPSGLADFHDSPNFFLVQKTMQAVVKSRAEPGLWLEGGSGPTRGTNAVVIRRAKKSFFGTDGHIYNLGALAAKKIPL